MRYCNDFRFALLLSALALSGCGLPYYGQAVEGQVGLLDRARPISQVIHSTSTSPALRNRLLFVKRVLRFAHDDLDLPLHRDYRTYANLHRSYVVWNVFAAPALSLRLKRWCFLIAGCVAYKGYFHRRAARRYGRRLAARGYDVYVSGVPAYATLGYLPDPVLNTFLDYPRTIVAHIIFHELAHDLLYVPGATTFDESFADTVADVGVARFVAASHNPRWIARYHRRLRHRYQVQALLRACHSQLETIYRQPWSVKRRLEAKAQAIARLKEGFARLTKKWGGSDGYGPFFSQPFNNAVLGAFGSYSDLRPAFRRILALERGQMKVFYKVVAWYARLPANVRDRALLSRRGYVSRPLPLHNVQTGTVDGMRPHVVRAQGARLSLTVHHRAHDQPKPL